MLKCEDAFRKFLFDIVPMGLKKFLDHSTVGVIMFRMAMEGARELIEVGCEEPKCIIEDTLKTLKSLGLIDEYEIDEEKAIIRLEELRRCVVAFILGAIAGTLEKFGKVNILTPIGKYLISGAQVTLKAEILKDGIEIKWSK